MAEPANASHARRNFGLDALRCLAIVIVVVHHGFLGFFIAPWGLVKFSGKAVMLSRLTVPSVEWLFVLSGFLIGTMMIRSFETETSFWAKARSFWLRRWFRTFPNYFLFLAVNAVIWVALVRMPMDRTFWTYDIARFGTFTQNLAPWWHEESQGSLFFFVEAWSLALDEWFYLVMPLLVGLFLLAMARGRDTKLAFLGATAALIAIPTAGRFLTDIPVDFPAWDLLVRRVTLLHLDATGWGVMAAVVARWYPDLWTKARGTKALVGVALLMLGIRAYMEFEYPGFWMAHAPHLGNALGIGLMGLGTAMVLPWLTRTTPPMAWMAKATAHLSNASYSIYLLHIPTLAILNWLLVQLVQHHVVRLELVLRLDVMLGIAALWLVLVYVLSTVVYKVFEKPVSDLRERFTRKVDANPFSTPTPPAPASEAAAVQGKTDAERP